MIPKIPFILLTGLGTILVLWAASAALSRLFVGRAIRRLVSSVGKNQEPMFSRALTSPLPIPVQRYFNYALREGQHNIRYAELTQKAKFRHRPGSMWFTVKAKEVVSAVEPGFVWDAVLRHHKLWWRTAKLSYLHNEGHGHLKLFGALTLQEYSGPETSASMLFRCLTEQVWLPTGLLPIRTLRWEEIDDNAARAIIKDGDTQVEAIFHINDIGQIERIVTNDKYRDHKSGFEQAQFTMLCSNYNEVEGMMIPTTVTFVWNLEAGDFEYGIFELLSAQYHFN